MNKVLIIALAICLVSVHAFVKRDAPAADQNVDYGTKMVEEFNKFKETVEGDLKKVFDPEKLKESINKGLEDFSKTVEEVKAKFAEKKN